jgi:hypothetical protein
MRSYIKLDQITSRGETTWGGERRGGYLAKMGGKMSKWVLEKQDVRVWTGYKCIRTGLKDEFL